MLYDVLIVMYIFCWIVKYFGPLYRVRRHRNVTYNDNDDDDVNGVMPSIQVGCSVPGSYLDLRHIPLQHRLQPPAGNLYARDHFVVHTAKLPKSVFVDFDIILDLT